jgi:mono/diheme cytochrome c family protein
MRNRILLLVASLSMAQDKPARSVWDGIYSDAQAARGETAYAQACSGCHGKKLEGRAQNPPLAGSEFLANWNGVTVGDLFDKMQSTMPADRPGKLSMEQNAEILAYMLKFNKFPPGEKDVPGSVEVLKGVRIEPAKGGSR